MRIAPGVDLRGRIEASGVKVPAASFNPDERVERSKGEAVRIASEFFPDDRIVEFHGGSYREVYVRGLGGIVEVHHMPADEVNGLERPDGPCIAMLKEDHRQTASCGMTRDAKKYRAQQAELIQAGDTKGAVKMDIEDIQGKFGNRYDGAIQEMLDYAERIGYIPDQEGLLND